MGLFVVLGLLPARFSATLLLYPDLAPLPAYDYRGYIVNSQDPSGYQELAQMITHMVQQHEQVTFLRYALPSPTELILSVYLPKELLHRLTTVHISDPAQVSPKSLNGYAAQGPTLTVAQDVIRQHNPGPHPQLWPVAVFGRGDTPNRIALYRWLLPPQFALHWLVEGGDANPRLTWLAPADFPALKAEERLLAWPTGATSPQALDAQLRENQIDYVLLTPAHVAGQPEAFAPFIRADETRLHLDTMPPGWYLVQAYPNRLCQWCLFQVVPPRQLIQATFDQKISLEGYQLSARQLAPGQPLHVTLYWHSLQSVDRSYTVFVHLLDNQGRLMVQVDEPPLWPTDQWHPNDRLADRHTLVLTPELPADTYHVSVGLYSPVSGQRLPIHTDVPLSDNALIIDTVSGGSPLD